MPPRSHDWQTKAILLLVLPGTAVSVVLMARWWIAHAPVAAAWTLGISALLGLLAWMLHAGTPAGAVTGALVTASLMFATDSVPFRPWESAIVPLLAFMVLTSLATRFGRARKQTLGTAESKLGRGAGQVAANLGFAALIAQPGGQIWIADHLGFGFRAGIPFFVLALAALAEAAADTVSSEIGQVLGGRPFMVTTFRRVEPGTDGAISAAGTLAGILAAGFVAEGGALALHAGMAMLLASWAGGVFGLLFDSLLGATLERRGWLGNDAVNFLSTISASAFVLGLLAFLPHPAIG